MELTNIKVSPKTQEIIRDEENHLSYTTRVPYFPLVVDRAEGSYVYDQEGNAYLDFLASAAVINVGHNNPRIVETLHKQLDKFIHYTPAYAYHEPHTRLANKLLEITPGNFAKRVAFGLSGSASVDGALKAAKAYTKRNKILSFLGSYHGTTYGALSVSGYGAEMHDGLGSLLSDIYFAKYPDYYRTEFSSRKEEDDSCLQSIRTIFQRIAGPQEFAAIIMEPIQGDAGILEPSRYFMEQIRRICDENGILLIIDEVQTGFGRTGKLFASDIFGIEPDILVLGKAIAAGMPLSALVARKEIFEAWSAPKHFFNTAGNVLSCVAALENIEIILEPEFLPDVEKKGEYLLGQFKEKLGKYECVGDIRGIGLLQGIDIVKNPDTKERDRIKTSKICWRAWEYGLILAFFSSNVLRIAPPLTLSYEDLDKAVKIITQSIEDVEQGKVPDSVLENIKGW